MDEIPSLHCNSQHHIVSFRMILISTQKVSLVCRQNTRDSSTTFTSNLSHFSPFDPRSREARGNMICLLFFLIINLKACTFLFPVRVRRVLYTRFFSRSLYFRGFRGWPSVRENNMTSKSTIRVR